MPPNENEPPEETPPSPPAPPDPPEVPIPPLTPPHADPPVPPMPSEHGSELLRAFLEASKARDEELRRLVTESLKLQFQRLDQIAQIWETALKELQPVAAEIRQTMELEQQVIAESDEATERLAQATAALIQLYQVMERWLVEVKRRDQEAEHPPAEPNEEQ